MELIIISIETTNKLQSNQLTIQVKSYLNKLTLFVRQLVRRSVQMHGNTLIQRRSNANNCRVTLNNRRSY
jgi:hypothetical protein